MYLRPERITLFIVFALAVAVLSPATSAAIEIVLVRSFDSPEDEANRLSAPMDLSVAAVEGLLYVADSGNNRVVVLDTAAAVRSRIGFAGSGDGRFIDPLDVGAGEGLHLYVLDGGNERIQVFDRHEQFLEVILSREEEEIGIPVGLEADPFGRLYIADAEEDRIRVFRSYTGEEEFSIGGFGTEAGRFRGPADVAVDRARRIFVTDRENDRVQVFDALGGYVHAIGEPEGPGRLDGPTGIAVDRGGVVFVADTENNRIALFDAESGRFLSEIVEVPSSPAALSSPRGVAVDDGGRLFVADTGNDRILFFRYTVASHAR